MKNNLLEVLPDKVKTEILKLNEIAQRFNFETFLVGGAVRDWILDYPIKDVDLLIVGDAIKVAEEYGIKNNVKISTFPQFITAQIHVKGKHLNTIDIISARKEIYPFPGAIPKVEKSNLIEDLKRRDFTINTLCYSLKEKEIIDKLNGLEDLYNKTIRIIHPKSFKEDPTRLIRAIKYKNRYNLIYEKNTVQYMESAINENYMKSVSYDRIKKEVFLILQESQISKIIAEMLEKNFLGPLFFIEDITAKQLNWLDKSIIKTKKEHMIITNLFIIFYYATTDTIIKFCGHYNLSKKNQIFFFVSRNYFKKIQNKLLNDNLDLFGSYELFKPLTDIQINIMDIIYHDIDYVSSPLKYYRKYLKHIKIGITGQDLLDLNIPPGFIYQNIFKELLKNKIENGWTSKEEEYEYLIKNLEKWK